MDRFIAVKIFYPAENDLFLSMGTKCQENKTQDKKYFQSSHTQLQR
jgi:hypothetical protein